MSRLIDTDKLDETIINLNDKGWDITRSEYKRLGAILFEMPTVKAIPIEKLKQIRRELDELPIYIAKFTDCTEIHICKDSVLEIIDKAIKEVSE